MYDQIKYKPTIGFICTWPVYQGTTIDRYAHSLIQGISAATSENGCNLLLGCGFSVTGNSPQNPSFWPTPGPDVNFVPVGPWNTDGQRRMVRDIMAVVRGVQDGRGLGVFYWDATWTAVPGNGWESTNPASGNAWENQALFDFDDEVLPALTEYLNP